MHDWHTYSTSDVRNATPLAKWLAGLANQSWLSDDGGRFALCVPLNALRLWRGPNTPASPGDESASRGDDVLVLTEMLTLEELDAVLDTFEGNGKDIGLLAVPSASTLPPPPGSQPKGDVQVAGGAYAVWRLPRDGKDATTDTLLSIPRIHGQELEGPGHLNGRARWFKRRHDD